MKLIANEEIRVDLYISRQLDNITRQEIQKLIKSHDILVNNEPVKPSYTLKIDDVITLNIVEEVKELKEIDLKLDIIYEDENLLVINKPRGLIVHAGVSVKEHTLVNHLLFHTKSLSLLGGEDRPGIVHRLDKDTSGLLVVAKTDEAYLDLVSQFKEGSVKRIYKAICNNAFKEITATIDMPIKRDEDNKTKMAVDPTGKRAITKIEVINQNNDYSYLECQLITGRTHQIRVHLSHIGHPVVGDHTYGKKDKLFTNGHMLHAETLGFIHPTTKKPLEFTYPLPKEFIETLKLVNL